MTEKRFKLIYNEYQTSNGKTIKAEPYFIDTKEEYVDEVYFMIKGYPTMSDEQVVDLLNEQEETIQRLKRTMKDVAELLSIEADLFSDKAIEHDINAYIELKEFDNKDAYYMAVSIKKAIKMLKGDVE